MQRTASTAPVGRRAAPWEGSKLVHRRKHMGMTQSALAAKTGIGMKLISAYENGHRQPRSENRRLLLEALGGTWSVEPLTPPPDPTTLARPDAIAEGDEWCAFGRAVKRLLGPRDAQINLVWSDANGDLAAIAETLDDNCLHTIRARVAPTTRDDLRSVRAVVERLEQKV